MIRSLPRQLVTPPIIRWARSNSTTKQANYMIPTESPFRRDASWLKKTLMKIGIGETNKFALRKATVFQYEACTDQLEPAKYFEHFQLSDTLYSFFLIVQLHVWMCQARSMKEGTEGRYLRNQILERFWTDFDERLKEIAIYSSGKRKEILEDLMYHHQGAMLSYDEGLLTDDKTLAAALWRTLFSKDNVEAEVLESAVKYVRIQMDHLRSIGAREWCLNGKFDWTPYPPLKC